MKILLSYFSKQDRVQTHVLKMVGFVIALAISLPAFSVDRQFTFINNSTIPIWVAGTTNPGTQPVLPDNATGFELGGGQQVTVTVPDHWNGRFWGRTGCSFNSNGTGSCVTGDCGGQLHCQVTGALPASLAEFNLTGTPVDYYDVSLVDGYNLPMTITPSTLPSGVTYSNSQSGSCGLPGCTTDLNSNCPTELQMVVNGVVVGCKSACTQFGDPKYCCTGAYNSSQACQPSEYSKIFKQACPTSYSYAYDDLTSTFGCAEGTNYTITFGASTGPSSTGSSSGSSGGSSGSSNGSSNGSSSGSSGGQFLANTTNDVYVVMTDHATGKCLSTDQQSALTESDCSQWNGQWWTTVWGQMSVCQTSGGVTINAGPIWSNTDAQQQCPKLMTRYSAKLRQLWKLVAIDASTHKYSIHLYKDGSTDQCLQAMGSNQPQVLACDGSDAQSFILQQMSNSQAGGIYKILLASDQTQCLTLNSSTGVDTSKRFLISGCDNAAANQQFDLKQQFFAATATSSFSSFSSSSGGSSSGQSSGSNSSAKTACLDAANQLRASIGLAPLTESSELESDADAAPAYDHSAGHQVHDHAKLINVGENEYEVGAVVDPSSVATDAVNSWWSEGPSSNGQFDEAHGHYWNLSHAAYTQGGCGFGVVNGTTYVYMDFK